LYFNTTQRDVLYQDNFTCLQQKLASFGWPGVDLSEHVKGAVVPQKVDSPLVNCAMFSFSGRTVFYIDNLFGVGYVFCWLSHWSI